jgi:hypothetical protein
MMFCVAEITVKLKILGYILYYIIIIIIIIILYYIFTIILNYYRTMISFGARKID